MLVLSRHVHEEVVIRNGDGEIVVKLLEASGGKARLGFQAPPDVQIDRREVYESKQRNGVKGKHEPGSGK